MNSVLVNASVSYEVRIGKGLLDSAGTQIREVFHGEKIALITDDNVNALYGDKLHRALESGGFKVCRFVFPHGEASKCGTVLSDIYGFLADNHFTRTDGIAALGGGVTGDMSGYAAATYLRGMDYIQIPTSLLAQVDSSVGGKTAIDIPQGKNLVGAFKQPKMVICDTDTLSTLPRDFLIDGMGEVIKYGMIRSPELFEILENNDISTISSGIEDIIFRCVSVKRDVVEADEFDKGERMILNFGHTLGHSIEQYYGYTGISHGRAVAKGMELITGLAEEHGMCGAGLTERLRRCLEKYELITEIKPRTPELGAACMNDKKNMGGSISVIICGDVGNAKTVKMTMDGFMAFIGGKDGSNGH